MLQTLGVADIGLPQRHEAYLLTSLSSLKKDEGQCLRPSGAHERHHGDSKW